MHTPILEEEAAARLFPIEQDSDAEPFSDPSQSKGAAALQFFQAGEAGARQRGDLPIAERVMEEITREEQRSAAARQASPQRRKHREAQRRLEAFFGNDILRLLNMPLNTQVLSATAITVPDARVIR